MKKNNGKNKPIQRLMQYRYYVVQALGNKCNKCGQEKVKKLRLDHIVAICNKGKDHFSNLQLLCINCHKEKTIKEISSQGSNEFVNIRLSIELNDWVQRHKAWPDKSLDDTLRRLLKIKGAKK